MPPSIVVMLAYYTQQNMSLISDNCSSRWFCRNNVHRFVTAFICYPSSPSSSQQIIQRQSWD